MKSFSAKVKISIFRPKTMDYMYSPWFDFWESEKSLEKRIPLERVSQGEQNGANFSFVAPSSEGLFLSTVVMTFTMHVHLPNRHKVTPHWKVL